MVTRDESPRFRALIADDDGIVRRVVSDSLSLEGFDCDAVFDGDEAWKLLSGPRPYDLLVTDLRMPAKNGHAIAVEALRAQPDLVVMVHTAVEEPRLTKDLIFRGVHDVVIKPTNYQTFAAKARGYVVRRQRRAANIEQHGREGALSGKSLPPGSDAQDGHAERLGSESTSAADAQKPLESGEQPTPFSRVASDVCSMAMRDDCEAEELSVAIEQDASLAAEVLKLANSSQPGSSQSEIESVEQAIIRLGRRSIGQLALSAVQDLRKKKAKLTGT